MRHRSVFLTLVTAVSLAFASTACDELGALIPAELPPLSTSGDPAVKAAGDSSETTDKIRQAEAELTRALETKDVSHLDKAVQLRPFDSTYMIQRMVLLWAEDQGDASISYAKALGLEIDRQKNVPDTSERDAIDRGFAIFRLSTLDTLITTKALYARDSKQWARLNGIYCRGIKTLQAEGKGVAELLYSQEDCK